MLTGMIAPYAGRVNDQAEKDNLEQLGWLLCDGGTVNRNTYATLYDVIGDFWGDGDGNTTFNLPDLRGYFMRGVDHGTGHDPDALDRTEITNGGSSGDMVGSYQGDAFTDHTHQFNMFVGDSNNWKKGKPDGGYVGYNQTGSTGSAGQATETRPKNVYVEFLIYWK